MILEMSFDTFLWGQSARIIISFSLSCPREGVGLIGLQWEMMMSSGISFFQEKQVTDFAQGQDHPHNSQVMKPWSN